MNEDIEKRLTAWFSEMTDKYSWLRIKFEFSERRGVFLVSFSPSACIDASDDFNKDALLFERHINCQYGDYAPLFTDEEELFKLSENAKIIKTEIRMKTNFVSFMNLSQCLWDNEKVQSSTLCHENNNSQFNLEPNVAFAA